jgi:hypothetical protein
MQYLVDNKEWIFSGIGVFVMASIWATARHLVKRRKTLPVRASKQTAECDLEQHSPLGMPASQKVGSSERAIHSLSIAEVYSTIRDAPVLQQPEVAKHFKGIRVKWNMRLSYAFKSGNGQVRMALENEHYHTAVLDVDPDVHPGLGLLRKGDSVQVEGTIEDVDGQVLLRDAVLSYGSSGR